MQHHSGAGQRKRLTLIKRVLLMQEFEELLDVHAILKVGPSGPESVS
jgi:hypothetical protein